MLYIQIGWRHRRHSRVLRGQFRDPEKPNHSTHLKNTAFSIMKLKLPLFISPSISSGVNHTNDTTLNSKRFTHTTMLRPQWLTETDGLVNVYTLCVAGGLCQLTFLQHPQHWPPISMYFHNVIFLEMFSFVKLSATKIL